ncbi:MAG: DUF4843 domain-containing protein [Odoribacteraceae bacterium]|jgi:hypothetical protein|nr:DUF4843 domain-containing protein [Odoribacteraceae bacterium]
MKTISNIRLLFGALLLLTACREEEIPLFEGEEAGVYFSYSSHATGANYYREYYYDSTTFSFGEAVIDWERYAEETARFYADGTPMTPLDRSLVDITEYTITLPIVTMGTTRDYPRPVKVVIDEARTTATRGFHFEADVESVVIPAGQSSTNLDVRILRTPDMLDAAVNIAFALEENEHFSLLFLTRKDTDLYSVTGGEVKATRFLIEASELYYEPFYWEIFCRSSYFGPWSVRKYLLVNETAGWTDADWVLAGSRISKVQLGRFGYIATLVQKKLQQMADAGDPMREADGSLMQQIGTYAVDYSAYE